MQKPSPSPDMNTKLNHIKSALRESIEIASKATEGPWEYSKGCTGLSAIFPKRDTSTRALAMFQFSRNDEKITLPDAAENATFIAHARTMTPLACKALLLAIDGLENVTCTEGVARNSLESITSTWFDA